MIAPHPTHTPPMVFLTSWKPLPQFRCPPQSLRQPSLLLPHYWPRPQLQTLPLPGKKTHKTQSHTFRDSSHMFPDSSNTFPDSSHMFPDSSHTFPDSSHTFCGSSDTFCDSSHMLRDSSHTFCDSSHTLCATRHQPKQHSP